MKKLISTLATPTLRGISAQAAARLARRGVTSNRSYPKQLNLLRLDQSSKLLLDLLTKLANMVALSENWDGNGSSPPTDLAIRHANNFLDASHQSGFLPSRLAASAIGGVGLSFRSGSRRVYVEFRNDGGVYSMLTDGVGEPLVRPVRTEQRDFICLLSDARDYLDGAACESATIASAGTATGLANGPKLRFRRISVLSHSS